ncbi:MAG: ATP-binding protein, partial [Acetobacteraceae bacterium]
REAAQARAAHAERMQALGQLAGGIAHDFNNVLQAVSGGATLLERRPTEPDSVRRFARIILDAASRGSSITRRLLAFAHRSDLRAEAVDVGPLLDGLREILEHTLGAGIEVEVEAAPDLPPLFADRSQLETVLVNLAANARDAMPEGGRVLLSAVADTIAPDARAPGLVAGPYIRLSVSDAGTGMDDATLARASEPFFTTKRQGKGTGLGLAMARGFAEQSGGALRIESRLGKGTTVMLWLPQTEEALAVAAPAGSRDTAPAVSPAARILLVDDDQLVRETLSAQLDGLGFSVTAVADGSSALVELDAGAGVDCLVADLAMPGIDGLTLIREAQRRRPHLA